MDQTTFFPNVIQFDPTFDGTNISTQPNLKFKFNLDVDSAQFSPDNALNMLVTLIEEVTDKVTLVHLVSYGSRILTITPASGLNPGSRYQITISRTLLSTEGRQMQANKTYGFVVSQTAIPVVPDIVVPADNSSVLVLPSFSWLTVTNPLSGYTLYYRIEADTSIMFNTVSVNGWTTTSVTPGITPGVALATNTSYFWRVRAEAVSGSSTIIGPWNGPFVFWYGTPAQPSPSYQVTQSGSTILTLTNPNWANGLTNQSIFPDMTFTINGTINPNTVLNSVKLYRRSVDGWPVATNLPVNTSVYLNNVLITGSTNYATSGLALTSVIRIVVNDPIVTNSRYTLKFNGLQDILGNIVAPYEIYFTSKYNPLYVGVDVIRANFGKYLNTFADDYINFFIYRNSLTANREYLWFYSPLIGGPTEEAVRNQFFQVTYPIEKWVEAKTGIQLLQAKLYELSNEAGVAQTTGEYSIQISAAMIGEIRGEIVSLDREAARWLVEFSKHRAVFTTASKSSSYFGGVDFTSRRWGRKHV